MAGSLVMPSNSQWESRSSFKGLLALNSDQVMKADATIHQIGNTTMAERTFMVPTTEVSTFIRFMPKLKKPLAL